MGAGTPPSREGQRWPSTAPANTKADTTAASPGTGDPSMSWHAYQPTGRTDYSMKKVSIVVAIATLALSAGVASAQTNRSPATERSLTGGAQMNGYGSSNQMTGAPSSSNPQAGGGPQWPADRPALRPGEWRRGDDGSQSAGASLNDRLRRGTLAKGEASASLFGSPDAPRCALTKNDTQRIS